MSRNPSDLSRAAGNQSGLPSGSDRHARGDTIRSAIAHFEAGRLGEARLAAEAVLKHNKKDTTAHLLLALIAERSHDAASAKRYAEKALTIKPHADAHMVLSRLDRQAGNTDAALEHSQRALAIKPGHVSFLLQRAGTLEEAGRVAEARAIVDPLIDGFEARGQALPVTLRYELAKLLVQEKNYGRAVEVIDELLGDGSTPRDLVRTIQYLKAKACDRSGRYEEAFDAATLGNDIGRLEFDPALYEQQVTALIETWSAERIAEYPRATCDDATPVFVAGMPRSGTSLIDQIIDAHPLAAGVGELATIEVFAARLGKVYDPDKPPPDCFGRYNQFRWTSVAHDYLSEVRRSAPPGVQRIVNKSLGNNKLVGLLALLFPRTRIIHALRDPRDVAISCYMGGFNNRLHAWSTRIEWVASAWEQSLRLMDHWKCILEIPILDVRYEELVRDPDSQFPRLIEFLGLEWDEACRAFHQSRRTVRTLSYDQVNRPLYTTSAGRHQHYAAQLEGVEFPDY
ncbi:MAG: sulfotransferase [Phycisphaeraceae bacterium]|nr:sulfotransferase [Phycisphaeraceae bacterium]